jgi:glucose/arabinose dehydrogenase
MICGGVARRLALVGILLVALACPGAASAGTPVAGFQDDAIATGLNQPLGLAFLPDQRMLVVEKGGRLLLADGQSVTTLTTIPVCTGSEMGLLGVAVDPSFTAAGSGFVYLYRTAPDSGGSCADAVGRFNQVVRVTLSNGAFVAGSMTVLLSGIRTDNGNHDGGTLRIGPDLKLYVTVGDTGLGDSGPPGASTNPYAQDLGALEGKVLRLELSGAPAAGNPFVGTPGARSEVFALGFRNPFRGSFEPQTGRLWVGDVGQSTWEEIDIVVPGGNYSWPHCEGTEPPGCMQPGEIAPIFTYATGSLGRAVTGGAFAPAGFGPYVGQYFFGDYTSSRIFRAVVNGTRDDIVGSPTDFVTGANGPVDIVFGPGTALYYPSINTGEVRQVTPQYPRPGGGTPARVALAPAFAPCSSPNSNHVAPLDLDSCSPPQLQSNTLTTSSVGRGAGSARLDVVAGSPSTPEDEADILINASASDVVCAAASAACPAGAGSDYTGRLLATTEFRLTDRASGPFQNHPATVFDDWLEAPMTCTATADPSLGANCSVATSADTLLPGFAREGVRSILSTFRVMVNDAGANGTGYGAGCPPSCGDGDERVYLRQAVFTP